MENINPDLKNYCSDRIQEFGLIDNLRKSQLQEIADYLNSNIKNGLTSKLCFICTHNSRRSHFGHIWSFAALQYYEVKGVKCFSGGTEATAINIRAVATLIRAGFMVENLHDVKAINPKYLVKLGIDSEIESVFSKVYDHPLNPRKDFAAILVCSDAESNCPYISGADKRFYLPYDDPKMFDSTEIEFEKYDERCQQIAREMLYLFSNVNMSL